VWEGSWLCEAALWTEWVHVGTVEAVSPCSIMVVDAQKLMQAAKKKQRYVTNHSYVQCGLPPVCPEGGATQVQLAERPPRG